MLRTLEPETPKRTEDTDIRTVTVPQTKYAGSTGSESSTNYRTSKHEVEVLASFSNIIRYS